MIFNNYKTNKNKTKLKQKKKNIKNKFPREWKKKTRTKPNTYKIVPFLSKKKYCLKYFINSNMKISFEI